MIQVKVVIPIYTSSLSKQEWASLRQVYKILNVYPIVVIKPESLNLDFLKEEFPQLSFECFDNAFFTGIPGYNRLMLSSVFYSRFADSQYILIYQLDAYVFSDKLTEWCNKGYDYVGAPWLKRPIYDAPVIKQWTKLNCLISKLLAKPYRQQLYNKVGNGGLSLRKTSSHLQVTKSLENRIEFYLSHNNNHLYNEDVFWSTEPPFFKYPDILEAVNFSFDKYPEYCYKLTGNNLPFGCHGWYKRKMKHFWKEIISY